MKMTLPSTFWTGLQGVDGFHVCAVCVGIRRSATTMIHQVIKDAFPEGGVLKTHSFLDVDPETPVIGTYRDFRDCAVSWWRTTKDDQLHHNASEVGRMIVMSGLWESFTMTPRTPQRDKISLEEAAEAVSLIRKDLFHMELYRLQGKRILTLNYEAFFSNPESIRDSLESHLGRAIPKQSFQQHSLQNNQALRRFTSDVSEGDSSYPPHCHEGTIGSWRRFCDDNVANFLNEALDASLRKYDYITSGEDQSCVS